MTKKDIIRFEYIFRPNLGSLKGKITRHPTQHVQLKWQDISRDVLEKYGNMTLTIELMAINKIEFIIKTTKNIQFGTAELICDKHNHDIYKISGTCIKCEGFQGNLYMRRRRL